MDYNKIGNLILQLRKEKQLTQKEVADILKISDKTISKYERGMGCPDISILKELSTFFHVNMEHMLEGEFQEKESDGGNMKRIQFYVCPTCGNIMTATSKAEISCCGRKLDALVVQEENALHAMQMDVLDNQWYVHMDHVMRKDHYISFVAYVGYDSVLIKKLYAEQSAETYLPYARHGQLYVYCHKDGLFLHKQRK